MEALKAFIKFIYTDTLDGEKDDLKALFFAADKYDIQVRSTELPTGSRCCTGLLLQGCVNKSSMGVPEVDVVQAVLSGPVVISRRTVIAIVLGALRPMVHVQQVQYSRLCQPV